MPPLQRKAKKQRAIVLFEDEASLSLNPTVGKTWAKIARTPSIRVTSKRGSISIISAISPRGMLLFTIPKGNINSDAFIKFLKQVLKEIPKKKIYIVVDNCASHKSKKTVDFTKKNTRLELVYLPPYSSDFNPDKLIWANLKHVELNSHQENTKQGLRMLSLGKMRKIQKKKAMIKGFVKKISLTKLSK